MFLSPVSYLIKQVIAGIVFPGAKSLCEIVLLTGILYG